VIERSVPSTNAPTDDIWEVLETCRAIRYLKPDPIPEAVLEQVLWAATRAPSPGNSQGWDFVVVDDAEAKRVIADAMGAAMLPSISRMQPRDRTEQLMFDGAAAIVASLASAPAVIFVTGPVIYPVGRPDESFTWSALYPAAQNILLAARALGLGTVFTTLHRAADGVIRDTLGIPDHIRIAATIPIGYPDANFGPVKRRPVADFVHRNRWQGDLRDLGLANAAPNELGR
jgi:nitroreductase